MESGKSLDFSNPCDNKALGIVAPPQAFWSDRRERKNGATAEVRKARPRVAGERKK